MRDFSKALSPKAVKDLERGFQLKRRAIELLDLVNAEWQSDPMSVQCFDLRIVQETKEVLTELKEINKRNSFL